MKQKVKKILAIPGQFLGKVSVRQLWKVLICLAVAIAIWFSALAAYQTFCYLRLSSSAPATVTRWQIKELGTSRFAVEAFFEFESNGRHCNGSALFGPPFYLNPFSAEGAIKAKKKETFTVWFQASNPSVCSLQKEFPLKSFMHALMTLGVFVYFLFISRKIPQSEEQERISPSKMRV